MQVTSYTHIDLYTSSVNSARAREHYIIERAKEREWKLAPYPGAESRLLAERERGGRERELS